MYSNSRKYKLCIKQLFFLALATNLGYYPKLLGDPAKPAIPPHLCRMLSPVGRCVPRGWQLARTCLCAPEMAAGIQLLKNPGLYCYVC